MPLINRTSKLYKSKYSQTQYLHIFKRKTSILCVYNGRRMAIITDRHVFPSLTIYICTYISFLVCIIKNDDISFWQTYPVIAMVQNTRVGTRNYISIIVWKRVMYLPMVQKYAIIRYFSIR